MDHIYPEEDIMAVVNCFEFIRNLREENLDEVHEYLGDGRHVKETLHYACIELKEYPDLLDKLTDMIHGDRDYLHLKKETGNAVRFPLL